MANDREDEAFDALMEEARGDAPSGDLMARVLADADRVQARPAKPAHAPRGRVPWWRGVIAGIGGWSAVSGITAAGIVGLAVGLYAPDEIEALLGGDALSFTETGLGVTPDLGELWTEGEDV
ncbi:dihydroorotate dehydrogenase [Hasllibacter sp. MH4015]|uniref:dihydroorotate dehydrogenase n=1 Tax=Hasllibacter sp. MH4015 TaxID=2854029 RepID=UPI001CD679A2|nr:dihydroorotate dehydrogenase [Hasllibacter sp. MH4015]